MYMAPIGTVDYRDSLKVRSQIMSSLYCLNGGNSMHQERERAPKDLERSKVIGCCRGKTGGNLLSRSNCSSRNEGS